MPITAEGPPAYSRAQWSARGDVRRGGNSAADLAAVESPPMPDENPGDLPERIQEQVVQPTAGEAAGQTVAPADVVSALVQQPAKNRDFVSLISSITTALGVGLGDVLGSWSSEKEEAFKQTKRELQEMTADRDGYRTKFHDADKDNAVLRQKLLGSGMARLIEGLGLCVFGAGLDGFVLHRSDLGIALLIIGAMFTAAGEFAARRTGGG
jgi:hypothetical protein